MRRKQVRCTEGWTGPGILVPGRCLSPVWNLATAPLLTCPPSLGLGKVLCCLGEDKGQGRHQLGSVQVRTAAPCPPPHPDTVHPQAGGGASVQTPIQAVLGFLYCSFFSSTKERGRALSWCMSGGRGTEARE